jgi:uncharacterized protein YbjT (DUF2867 family)
LAGRHTVKALRDTGHDPVVVARSVGVDLTTGRGQTRWWMSMP